MRNASYVYVIQDREDVIGAWSSLNAAKNYATAHNHYTISQYNGSSIVATHCMNIGTDKWVRWPQKEVQRRVHRAT